MSQTLQSFPLTFTTATEAFNNPAYRTHGLQGYCPLPVDALTALAKAQGVDANDTNNYYDPEAGYDGWELRGMFDGQPFNLYTRYGTLKVGALDGFDVNALNFALAAAIAKL